MKHLRWEAFSRLCVLLVVSSSMFLFAVGYWFWENEWLLKGAWAEARAYMNTVWTGSPHNYL